MEAQQGGGPRRAIWRLNPPSLSILLVESPPAETLVSGSNRSKESRTEERSGGSETVQVADTNRDRIRQKVVETLRRAGYEEGSIRLDESYTLKTEDGSLEIPIEAVVFHQQVPSILVKCVHGNLSTRERASLALARLLYEQPIPFAIVAGDTDAVVFDTRTGRAVGNGYGAFPSRDALEQRLEEGVGFAIPAEQQAREKRILLTYYHLRCSVDLEPF